MPRRDNQPRNRLRNSASANRRACLRAVGFPRLILWLSPGLEFERPPICGTLAPPRHVGSYWLERLPFFSGSRYTDSYQTPNDVKDRVPEELAGPRRHKMKATGYMAPRPKTEPPVVLAGILPKMVELAASETMGTHTYLVLPEHTARVRSAIGPDKWICAEQAVMFERDPARAREAARKYMRFYLRLPGSSYVKNLRTFGFGDADFADEFSDRLVDAVVAWGGVRESERIARPAPPMCACCRCVRTECWFPTSEPSRRLPPAKCKVAGACAASGILPGDMLCAPAPS